MINVMLHVNAATLRRLTSFVSYMYIMQFQKNSSLGEGVYSQLKAYKTKNTLFKCAMVM